MAMPTKALLYSLFVDLLFSCRMIMAVGYDATLLSQLCRPVFADPGEPCEFLMLRHEFDKVHSFATYNRDKAIVWKTVDPTDNHVTCYISALCHKDVKDCDGCLATARRYLGDCMGYVGAQANLKDCEIKYDKYGQFEH